MKKIKKEIKKGDLKQCPFDENLKCDIEDTCDGCPPHSEYLSTKAIVVRQGELLRNGEMRDTIDALMSRIERLEEQVAELNIRTMGQMIIGPGYHKPEMPDISLLESLPLPKGFHKAFCKHNKFPCKECGIKHFDNCECSFCR